MRLLWLPSVLRAAGLTVHEYSGWQTRGYETWGPLRGVVCHHTASSTTSTVAGDTRVLWVTGSVTAPAPISQCYLARSGEWWVGAAGRCNHVKIGDLGPHAGYGNYQLIGIEAANNGVGEPWSPTMLDSYQRGVAAICRHMGWPASVVVAHREHQSGKTDPYGIDMGAFRQRVAALLTGDDDMELTDRVPSAATADVPNRTVDQVLGDLWRGVHLRQTEFAAEVRTRLSAIEAKLADPVDEQALAAALGPLLQPGVTVEQIRQLLASVRLTPGA